MTPAPVQCRVHGGIPETAKPWRRGVGEVSMLLSPFKHRIGDLVVRPAAVTSMVERGRGGRRSRYLQTNERGEDRDVSLGTDFITKWNLRLNPGGEVADGSSRRLHTICEDLLNRLCRAIFCYFEEVTSSGPKPYRRVPRSIQDRTERVAQSRGLTKKDTDVDHQQAESWADQLSHFENGAASRSVVVGTCSQQIKPPGRVLKLRL